MNTKSPFIVLIPLTLALTSCRPGADIRAAQDLAQLQVEARELFPKIANDVYRSCLRSANYTVLTLPSENPRPTLENQSSLALPRENSRLTSGNQSSISRGVLTNRRKAQNECNAEESDLGGIPPQKAAQALNDSHRVILRYLSALGKLVADETTVFDTQLDKVGSSIANLPGLKAQESKQAVTAGTAIAKFLFQIASEAYRREQLKKVVIEADPSLQVLTQALTKAVQQGYIEGSLVTEEIRLDLYYNNVLPIVLRAETAGDLETREKFDALWREKDVAIDAKKVLASEYISLLNNIATDHNSLKEMYVKGDEPDPAVIKAKWDKYTQKMKALHEKSNKLFQDK